MSLLPQTPTPQPASQQQGSWWTTPSLGRNTLKGATEGGLIGGAWGCGVGMVAGAGPETPAGWVGCGAVGLGGLTVGFVTGAVGGAWDYYSP